MAEGGVKDPQAPILGGADYGFVDDFQSVIPILKERAKGVRQEHQKTGCVLIVIETTKVRSRHSPGPALRSS